MDCASSPYKNSGPAAWLLDDGTRLHLQHGPIDLIIDAVGSAPQVQQAFKQAATAFQSVLDTLASQLSTLRKNYQPQDGAVFKGAVAKRMRSAVRPYSEFQVTPMAAVAGAVADHVLSCMIDNCELDRAQVNNGGDIALYLSPASEVKIGICTTPRNAAYTDTVSITANDNVQGVATSGWQGRSFSLGIADAVTVLATSAATADVAATLIANAVDLPTATQVVRAPAISIQPDSDLGDRLITVDVAPLNELCKKLALDAGESCAKRLLAQGKIHSCYLHLQGQTRIVESSCLQTVFPVRQRYAHC